MEIKGKNKKEIREIILIEILKMKRYKCLGCRFENINSKMDDNICPYCGEFMEEYNDEIF